jgi:hypothetical protein
MLHGRWSSVSGRIPTVSDDPAHDLEWPIGTRISARHGPRKGFVTNGATIAPKSSPMASVTRICREIMASRRRSTSPVDWSAASSILC